MKKKKNTGLAHLTRRLAVECPHGMPLLPIFNSIQFLVCYTAGACTGQPKYAPLDLNTSSLKMYWGVVKRFGGQELWRELLTVLQSVAQKHDGASIANVALRWVMQQGDGMTVFPIVGLRGIAHVNDNAAALALNLDAEDMAAIDAVLARSSGPVGDIYSFERGG